MQPEKKSHHIQEILYVINSLFLIRHYEGQRAVKQHIQCPETKKSTKTSISRKLSFKSEGEIKTVLCKQNLRESVTTKSVLQEILKRVLEVEMKNTKH